MLRAIRIRPGRPVRAMKGHPWAFLGEVEVAGAPPADGDCVELTDPKGRSLGAGLWNGKSQIAWRRYARRPVSLDGPLLEELITAAVRRRGDRIITETKHGFICANSGVDLSNVERGYAALLPLDSDRSARRIRAIIKAKLGVSVGVIVSDTFGRPWRKGLTDVAIGVAGIAAVHDLRGTPDALGRVMQVTEVSIADEVASAAELVMGKSSGIPVAVVRGLDPSWFRESSMSEIVRPAQEDLFR